MVRAAGSTVMAAFLLSAAASATVIVPAEFREIVEEAAIIVRGHITDVRAVVVADQGVETIATIAVDARLKGSPEEFVSMRIPGGVVGRYRWVMVGAPVVRAGQQSVFFLKRDPSGAGWRPVGLTMGIYDIRQAPRTRTPMVDPPPVAGRNTALGPIVRGDPQRKPMALTEFESLIRVVMANQTNRSPAPRPR